MANSKLLTQLEELNPPETELCLPLLVHISTQAQTLQHDMRKPIFWVQSLVLDEENDNLSTIIIL
ncbi:MAG: hypothetical protein RR505_01480 [Raoultibacter sp.]